MLIRSYLIELNKRVTELARYGNTRKVNTSMSTFKQEIIRNEDYQPIIFLSTGRTGTKLFSELLSSDKSNYVLHSSKINLIEQGKVAYESYHQSSLESHDIHRLTAQTYLAAREVSLFECYIHQKRFIETNNRITFLAPGIKYWIPGTKIVYLYRHPGDFIRSGIRRRWYDGAPHDIGRLQPDKLSPYQNQWSGFHRIQKIAWLWNETNSFIERFLSNLPKQDYLKLNFSELNLTNAKTLIEFVGAKVSESVIKGAIAHPVNVQSDGDYPIYVDWPDQEKEWVKLLCGDLASRYGYELD